TSGTHSVKPPKARSPSDSFVITNPSGRSFPAHEISLPSVSLRRMVVRRSCSHTGESLRTPHGRGPQTSRLGKSSVIFSGAGEVERQDPRGRTRQDDWRPPIHRRHYRRPGDVEAAGLLPRN